MGSSSLIDFWVNLTSAFKTKVSSESIKEGGKKSRTGHFADARNFSNLIDTFLGVMPDPDEVLKKAGLNAGVYRDILTDAHAGGAMIQRKSRVKRMKRIVLPGDITDTRSIKAAEMVEAQFDNIDRMPNVVNEILESFFFGATYLEMYWSRDPITDSKQSGEIVLTDLMSKPFEWFAWDLDGQLVIKQNMLSPMNTVPVPENKIYPVVRDGTYINPYGDRAAKRAYWPFLFKKGGLRFWTEFLEKFGQPFIFGKPDPAKNEDEVDLFFDALVDMVRNGIVVSQMGSAKDEIDIIESGDKAGSTDAHKAYKNAMNIEISKSILAETLTIENSETGSQAATTVHFEVLESVQDEDRQMVENALSGIAKKIVVLNMGTDINMPIVKLVDEENLSKELAERDSILSKNLGVKFNKGYISKSYNVQEEDFEIGSSNPEGAETSSTPPAPPSPAINDPKGVDEGAEFSEAEEFAMQKALDSYIDDSLNRYDRLTAPVRQRISVIIKKSKNFSEFTVNMAELKDQMDNGLFSRVFQDALGVAEVAGVWAVDNNIT